MKSLIKYKNRLYDFLAQWVVTRRYIHKLDLEFDILRPGDVSGKKQQILNIMGSSLLAMAVLIWWMLQQEVDLYSLTITAAMLYFIYHQVIHIHLQREEYKLLHDLEKFLGDMRHEYYVTQMVDEAVYKAAEKTRGMMQLHGEYICELLSDPDMEGALERYQVSAPNGYFKTLLAICISAIQFGDKIVNEQSLFLMNLSNLRQEVNVELLKRNKISYAFSGLVLLCIIPMLTLRNVEQWGISNLPELVEFYHGTWGVLCSVLIVVCSMVSYHIVMILKENIKIRTTEHPVLEWLLRIPIVNQLLWKYLNHNYGRTMRQKEILKRAGDSLSVIELLLKRLLSGMTVFLLGVCLSVTVHRTNCNRLYDDVTNIEALSAKATKEQIQEMQGLVQKLTKRYMGSVPDYETIQFHVKEQWPQGDQELVTATAKEISRRVIKIHEEHLHWYEPGLWILAALAGFYFPLWFLLYRTKVRQMNMEDEVVQFQSVILMLIYLEQVTVELLLRWMENFADIFHPAIEECINNYPWNDKKALEILKEEEPFEPFSRIVENLEMCEQIGVQKAFEEIAMDRNHFQEKRKQQNQMQINKKSVYARIVAYIPLLVTIGLYLIIPFVAESISQLLEYSAQMQAL